MSTIDLSKGAFLSVYPSTAILFLIYSIINNDILKRFILFLTVTSSVQDQGPGDFGSTTGLGTSKSSKLSTQEVITEELRRSSPSELLSYGYGLRDLILSCSYSGYDCTNP